MSRPDGLETTPVELTELEGLLAAYAVSTTREPARHAEEIRERLEELRASRWLLENIRRGSGGWTVSDDDRIDVIIGYSAKRARAPERIVDRDVARLRAVGLTDFDVVDLNNVVAYYR